MARARLVSGSALLVAVVAGLAAPPVHAAPEVLLTPDYPSAACTPTGGAEHLGLVPQQWNAAMGLPLWISGTPARQRIVIAEIAQSANEEAVNKLLVQCGLAPVRLTTATNPWFSAAAAPGAEATLDATIVAAALPPNAEIAMVDVPVEGDATYAMLVAAAHACGFNLSDDPRRSRPMITPGPRYPNGGCIISISYGGAEAATASARSDWMMQQLADQGVIVVAAAGDEGSGGCITSGGQGYGTQSVIPVRALAQSGSQVTVTTGSDHGFKPGDSAYLTVPGWRTPTTVVIASVPSPTTYTFLSSGPEVPAGALSGSTAVGFGRLTPEYLASNPNALAVGGVQWDAEEDALSAGLRVEFAPGIPYHPVAWRDAHPNENCANVPGFDPSSPSGGAEATGGGQSRRYPMPAYQATAAQRHYASLPRRRMMPDVAALAGWPTYAIANYGLPVTAKQLAGSVATLSTPSALGLEVGETVTVSGLGSPFDGTFAISASTPTSISYIASAPNATPATPAATQAVATSGGRITQSCVGTPCEASEFPWISVVGTSAATPLIAVGIANVNAALSTQGLPALDNSGGSMDVHGVFYDLRNASAMIDVTSGSNDIFGLGGWRALRGYDMTTGMGVPNFSRLARLIAKRIADGE